MTRTLLRRPLPAGWALALLLVVVVGPLVQIVTAQPAVRLAQSAALVEHRSLQLDPYADTLLVDKVELDGHTYSDKAPLQAFLAAPVYAVGRAMGMESAEVPRADGNLALWWVTLWSATLPAAALVVLMHRAARRVAPRGATLATIGMAFGSLLLPFSGELYGHVLCALAAFAAWQLVDEPGGAAGRLVAVGALLGASVAIEYPMALVALVVVAGAIVVRGWRVLGPIALGSAPFGAFLLWYQWAAFGSPFTDPYRLKPQHADATAAVTGLPRPAQAVEVLLGSRGLLIFAPVCALGLIGLVLAWREGDRRRRTTAAVGLGAFAVLWLLQSGWSNPWGGEMPGPRYVLAALPFLAPGLAVAAERWRTVVVGATAWGILAMAGPLLTVHLVFDGGTTMISHLDNLRRWGAAPPVSVLALGSVGWLLYGAAIAAALAVVVRSVRAEAEALAEQADETADPATPRVPAQV